MPLGLLMLLAATKRLQVSSSFFAPSTVQRQQRAIRLKMIDDLFSDAVSVRVDVDFQGQTPDKKKAADAKLRAAADKAEAAMRHSIH